MIAHHETVWFWVGQIEKERDLATLSKFTDRMSLTNLKNIANTDIRRSVKQIGDGIADGMKEMTNVDIVGNMMELQRGDTSRITEGADFWLFRVLLISVYVLYGGFGLYSLVAIGDADGL